MRPRTDLAFGEFAAFGPIDVILRAAHRHVFAGRVVCPHDVVHRRGQQDRFIGREQYGCREIAGLSPSSRSDRRSPGRRRLPQSRANGYGRSRSRPSGRTDRHRPCRATAWRRWRGVTNSLAAAVSTQHGGGLLAQARIRSRLLYAAIPPATISRMRLPDRFAVAGSLGEFTSLKRVKVLPGTPQVATERANLI